jgi:hypothetical protein
MQDRFRNLYNYLLENGELLKLFPRFTSDWEKDKKIFIREQVDLENLVNDFEINEEDEDSNY